MLSLKGLAIKYKVLVIGAVGVVGFAANFIFSYYINTDNQNRLENIKNADFPILEIANANVNRLEKVKLYFTNAVQMGEEELIETAELTGNELISSLAEITNILNTENINQDGYQLAFNDMAKNSQADFDNYFKITKLLSENMINESIEPQAMSVEINKMNQALKVVDGRLRQFQTLAHEHLVNTIYDAKAASEKATQLALAIGISVILVLGATAYVMGKFIRQSVKDVADSLNEIANGNGDLTKRLSTPNKDEIGDLVNNFNSFVIKLQSVLKEVSGSTQQLSSSSENMLSISSSANKTAQHQQAQVDHVAAAIHQMTSSVQGVAENAKSASTAAQEANNTANSGKLVVGENMDAIQSLASEVSNAMEVTHKLEADSKNIGLVLDVIKGIAEQTNLLALNAAIEAARAGDQGRGFSVVADEVRTLASRTQESTQEIEQIISGFQDNSKDIVTAMQRGEQKAQESVESGRKVEESLTTINEAVNTINNMNLEIEKAIEEQRTMAVDVNRNVSEIRSASDQAVSGAEQTASSSDQLSKLSTSLQQLVSQFRV